MLYLMVQKVSLLYLEEGSAGQKIAMFWLMMEVILVVLSILVVVLVWMIVNIQYLHQ